jgi:hypothetical protein
MRRGTTRGNQIERRPCWLLRSWRAPPIVDAQETMVARQCSPTAHAPPHGGMARQHAPGSLPPPPCPCAALCKRLPTPHGPKLTRVAALQDGHRLLEQVPADRALKHPGQRRAGAVLNMLLIQAGVRLPHTRCRPRHGRCARRRSGGGGGSGRSECTH